MGGLIGALIGALAGLIRVLIRNGKKKAEASRAAGRAPAAAAPARKPVLRCVAGSYQGAVVELDRESCTIGRDSRVANLIFPPESTHISTRHCKVRYRDGKFEVEDFHSTNGTSLASGQKLEPGRPHTLAAGDQFYLAEGADVFEVNYD
jgi:hypothetical protein